MIHNVCFFVGVIFSLNLCAVPSYSSKFYSDIQEIVTQLDLVLENKSGYADIDSGKVTLLKYGPFSEDPFPASQFMTKLVRLEETMFLHSECTQILASIGGLFKELDQRLFNSTKNPELFRLKVAKVVGTNIKYSRMCLDIGPENEQNLTITQKILETYFNWFLPSYDLLDQAYLFLPISKMFAATKANEAEYQMWLSVFENRFEKLDAEMISQIVLTSMGISEFQIQQPSQARKNFLSRFVLILAKNSSGDDSLKALLKLPVHEQESAALAWIEKQLGIEYGDFYKQGIHHFMHPNRDLENDFIEFLEKHVGRCSSSKNLCSA